MLLLNWEREFRTICSPKRLRLPRGLFHCVPSMFDSSGVKVPSTT